MNRLKITLYKFLTGASRAALLALPALALACGPMARGDDISVATVGRSPKLLETENAIPNRFIVLLAGDGASGDVGAAAADLTASYGGRVDLTYRRVLRGFAVEMDAANAVAMSEDPHVKYMAEDGLVDIITSQNGATWGLDRIDQRDLPLDETYIYEGNGAGVSVYVIDTGIRLSHNELTGRAHAGFSSINDGNGTNDCNGHGTHVAGTIAGSVYGVAKAADVYAVRVLDCGGSGTFSGVIAGIEWVTENAQLPAVANMSLGGAAYQPLNEAVEQSIAAGVVYAVAAGNENTDACSRSPASAPSALTAGATDINDARASFSNFGTCVDVFAPGVSITSAWHTSDAATHTISGTSMASPHVAGVATLFLGEYPSAGTDQVASVIVAQATSDHVANPGAGSPNELLFMGFIGGDGDFDPPTVELLTPAENDQVAGAVTLSASADDPSGIAKIQFRVNNILVDTVTGAPYSTSWNSITVVDGPATVKATAFDTNGNSASDEVTVQVNNSNAGELASFDPTLLAPRCYDRAAVCDTGDLVTGRGNIYPEANQPNTLHDSCADGQTGSHHADESIDRIRIYTQNGGLLAAGSEVTIEVSVWAYASYSGNHLHIYHTTDVATPAWNHITTLVAPGPGAQTITTTLILPDAEQQAVRAAFGWQNATPNTCSTGVYDERDDLVFAVAPESQDPSGLVISEILYNPAGTEPYAEWLEILNTSEAAIELDDLTLSTKAKTRSLAGAGELAAGARLILCRDATTGPQGCVSYGTLRLRNAGDHLALHAADGTLIDEVVYTGSTPWPASTNGVAIELSEAHLNANANDDAKNWCHAVSPWGGELATPGTANDCLVPRAPYPGELVVSEIMYNPAGVEPHAEWVEITNPTAYILDLTGLELHSGTSSSSLGQAGLLGPGARVVACRSMADGPNGCLPYSAVRLNNTGNDELQLVAPEGILIDAVSYGTAGDWPVSTNGVAIELSESALDAFANDDAGNWCAAAASFGEELATPGDANSCP